jgi:hypothetical protein
MKCNNHDCQVYSRLTGKTNCCHLTRVELKVFNKLGFDLCSKTDKKHLFDIMLDIINYIAWNKITYKDVKGENSPKFNEIRNYILTNLLKEI